MEEKKALYGYSFVLPWIIGFVLFFLVPLVQSVMFTFSDVSIDLSGMIIQPTGLENYKYILFEDPDYTRELLDAFGKFVYSLPFIVIFSIILAIILNQKFSGRMVFRSIFFLPVIISTGVIASFILNDDVATQMQSSTDTVSVFLGGFIDFTAVLKGLGLPEQIIDLLVTYIEEIFNLLWKCGVPILLFISGLQAIPGHLYEVGKVEGATAWEGFWYITFPMLGNTLTLVTAYVSIDILTGTDNKIMEMAFNLMQQQIYNKSSAMIWVYFILIIALLGVLFALFYNYCLKRWEK